MSGSNPNPFGQSSNSLFGSPLGFGQSSNSSNNNPFAPKPFGSTTPFGGSSSPAFGVSSSTPAFGASSSPFGGSSVFGQKPASSFGAFGSTTPTQPSPFVSTAQPSQPAFGSSLFGSSTGFGAQSQPAFGATTQPAFGATSQPAFGATTQPAFGATSQPAFGATTQPAFGATSQPGFGSTSTTAFGAQSASAFGSPTPQPFGTGAALGSSMFGSGGGFGTTSPPAFGNTTTPAFGAQSGSAFGATSSPAFSFGSSPAFGQSTATFGSSPFATSTTPSPFGAQSSVFGAQTTTPTFGNTTFGQSNFGGAQRGGSRVTPYALTADPDSGTGKLMSISAMSAYKDKSHEELRWEDYQSGDKGGRMPAAQTPGMTFNTPASQPSPVFSQPSPSPFANTASSNIFAPKTSTPTPTFNTTGFGAVSNSSSSLFGASSAPSLFSTVSAAFPNTSSSSIFPTSSPSFAPPTFSTQAPGTTSGFGTSLFSSATPSQTGGAFGQTTTTFGPTTSPSFTQPNLFSSPSTGFGNTFTSFPSLSPPTNPLTFNQSNQTFPGLFSASQPAQQTNSSFSMFPNSQPGAASTGASGNISTPQNQVAAVQPVPATNPFGTLPAMPQMSIGRGGTTPSVQYGISSMPVSDKAAPVRISSILTSRNLSHRRIRLPVRKYNPKTDGAKVPFFSDDDETASTHKADALFLPRENPRALLIRPADQWSSKSSADKPSPLRDSTPVPENGKSSGEAHTHSASNGLHSEDKDQLEDDDFAQEKQKGDSNGVTDNNDDDNDIEALMPKLRCSDYYTEPRIQELAAKERAEPGYCSRVKDFVVGRHGYGRIKFFGETDVRRLDLESLVQFNNREVIVYTDDSKKPPVGQGLNKPAEVTLLNIKCFDKKTGRHVTEGPKIDKYTEMLKRKGKDQGAEFVSYVPVNGEWKFRVHHFSGYKLTKEDELGF